MKVLIQHITRLVSQNNCVIIPGLGAFIAHNIPARYNIKEQVFTPPCRTLSFNADIKIDDALLLSAYMKHDNQTYQQAEQSMNKDINRLRNKLASKGTVQFGELGTFSMDINNSIMFEVSANGIDDPDNFGLQPLYISTLHNKSEKTITIKRKELSRYIAVVAAVILMFLFVTPISDKTYENDIKASLSGFASSEQISMMQQLLASSPEQIEATPECEITPVEYSATKGVTTTKEQNAANNKNTEPVIIATITAATVTAESATSTAETAPAVANPQQKYYIIVASSPNEDNAQLAIRELTAKHQAEYNVVKCGKRHRIAISSFNSESEAQNALQQYQPIFPDAWILTH